jgi:hypothetical protein
MITINGYRLREALKEKQLELATLQSQWDESLVAFAGEEKARPDDLANAIFKLEMNIARLQELQSDYNLKVKVDVCDVIYTLECCIKIVGGAGRLSKRWREAAKGEKVDRYDRGGILYKEKDKEYAKPVISKTAALIFAKAREKYASQVRNAIAKGNLTDIEYEDSVKELFA